MSDRGVVLFHDTCEHNDVSGSASGSCGKSCPRDYPELQLHARAWAGGAGRGENYPRELDVFFKASPEQQAILRGAVLRAGVPLKDDEVVLRESVARARFRPRSTSSNITTGDPGRENPRARRIRGGFVAPRDALAAAGCAAGNVRRRMETSRDQVQREKEALEDELKDEERTVSEVGNLRLVSSSNTCATSSVSRLSPVRRITGPLDERLEERTPGGRREPADSGRAGSGTEQVVTQDEFGFGLGQRLQLEEAVASCSR